MSDISRFIWQGDDVEVFDTENAVNDTEPPKEPKFLDLFSDDEEEVNRVTDEE